LADLHVVKAHTLSFLQMRKVAFAWAEEIERDFGMTCIYEEGQTKDELIFSKSGLSGCLKISHQLLDIEIHLGLLLRPLKSKIEGEIFKNLDKLLNNSSEASSVSI